MHGKRKIGNELMCNMSSHIWRNVLRRVTILQSKIEYYCLFKSGFNKILRKIKLLIGCWNISKE